MSLLELFGLMFLVILGLLSGFVLIVKVLGLINPSPSTTQEPEHLKGVPRE